MKVLLPIELDEVILIDEKGEQIKGIKSITSFKKGIVIFTDTGIYTNEKSLIKKRKKYDL